MDHTMAHNYFQAFSEAGHRVFTVNRIVDNNGVKSCGCDNPKCTAIGKHPVADNWQRTPLWDEDQIDGMAMTIEQLGRGYGVLCNELLVVDVDARNGGVASYQMLVEKFPSIAACGLIVETGSGKGSRHLYFKLNADVRISQTHKDFPGIDFKHSGFVIGPGCLHASGNNYKVLSGDINDIDDAPEELVTFLKKMATIKVEYDGKEMSLSDHTLHSMLDSLDCYDEYDDWVKVGMALHDATSGNGVELWRDWSSKSAKYDPGDIDYRWHSFGKSSNPIRVGTLIKMAKDNGWIEPVTQDGNEPELQGWFAKALTGSPVVEGIKKEDLDNSKNPIKNCPVDVSKIDLTAPPGFVGEVTKWINSQCMYPRYNLAACAALFAVGNIAGLRYAENSPSKTRTNLAFFCIAGSGTGKDAVLSASKKLLEKVGMGKVAHGNFKSDREIYQNLIRHQISIYTIDEVGARFGKIANAGKGGGASHLDGVIESFMEIYTKSNSTVYLTGDAKVEVDKDLRDRYALIKKKIDENEYKNGKGEKELRSIERRLSMDGVIDQPFISLIGFTTPTQFSRVMTLDNVETGFLGRTILCMEPDINPQPDMNFSSPPIPTGMSMRLMQLAWGGSSSPFDGGRIENLDDLIYVNRSEAAEILLERLSSWCWQLTQSHIDTNGGTFVALYRRLYEKIIKISTTLGVADGAIDVEHVSWATAMALRDIEEKIAAVTIQDDSFSKGDKLNMSIIKAVQSQDRMSLSQISNRSAMRKYRKEDVETAVNHLVGLKLLIEKVDTDKRNGKIINRYSIP